jgi:hypothetical protein
MSEKNIPDCSDQLKEYLHRACKIVNDVCKKDDMPQDAMEGINYTLQMIGISKKSDKTKRKAMEEFEKYAKDDTECKI